MSTYTVYITVFCQEIFFYYCVVVVAVINVYKVSVRTLVLTSSHIIALADGRQITDEMRVHFP